MYIYIYILYLIYRAIQFTQQFVIYGRHWSGIGPNINGSRQVRACGRVSKNGPVQESGLDYMLSFKFK